MNAPTPMPTETSSSTSQTIEDIPKDLSQATGADIVSFLGVGAVVAWQAGRMIMRRFSKDNMEMTKDRAETNIVLLLQEDNAALHKKNDSLMERIEVVSKERNEAVSQLGRFLAESELYKEKITELQSSVISMAAKLEEQSELLKTVLVENGGLKVQVELLEKSNSKLINEMDDLSITLREMNHPGSRNNGKSKS